MIELDTVRAGDIVGDQFKQPVLSVFETLVF